MQQFRDQVEASQIYSSARLVIDELESDTFFELLQGSHASQIVGGVAAVEETATEHVASSSHQFRSDANQSAVPKRPRSYWSASLQTLLDQPPSSLPRNLAIGGFVFCCSLSIWAWFGQINQVSHAQGRLVPKGEVYKIQPVTQSEVAKIAVKEGQTVKAGQVIAELDNQLAATEVERLKQNLAADQLRLLQTQGLIDQLYLEARTRQAISTAEIQAQIATIAQARAKATTNRQVLPQIQAEIAAYEARLAKLQPLVAVGALAQDHLFEVEQSLRQRQQTMTQNQGDLQQVLAEQARLQSGLAEKQAAKQKDNLETQQQLQQLQMEATQIRSKITETETELRAARMKQKQLFLYASVDGTVTSLKVHNTGEVVQPGQTVAEIAPAKVPLVLSTILPSREAGLVRKGMPVQIKFDAFPYQDYGMIAGKVTSISPDTEVDQQLGAVYRVEIAPVRGSIVHNHQTIPLKAGQTANTEIIVKQRRIIDVLLEPIRQLQGGVSL